MFSHANLQELLAFNGQPHRVLSLYLNTSLGEQSRDTIKLKAKSLLKEAKSDFAGDVARIESYLEQEHDWSSQGLALFTCAAADFWRTYPTAVAFRDRVRIKPTPHVKPLAHLLDFYAHFGVMVVDRIGARFFAYHLGELTAEEGTMGDLVHKHKDGQGSSIQGVRGGVDAGRANHEAVMRNFRDTADAAAVFFRDRQIRRLFVGGTAETVSEFREFLPKRLLSCLAGTFVAEMDAPEHQIRLTALALLRETNARREAHLVEEMITAAAKSGNAVVGLESTLQAAYERRIQTLLICDGYRQRGYRYGDSGFLSSELVIAVPEAAGEPQEVEDVIEEVVSHTLTYGGHVELISDNPALEGAGQIGAILRY